MGARAPQSADQKKKDAYKSDLSWGNFIALKIGINYNQEDLNNQMSEEIAWNIHQKALHSTILFQRNP